MFNKIMVALDESAEADRAFRVALQLAKVLHSELSVVTVLEPFPGYYSFAVFATPGVRWIADHRSRSEAIQRKACQAAEADGLAVTPRLIDGEEVNTIIQCAKKYGTDLLVLGMRDHTLLMTHTGHDIADHSPCALLGVR